MISPYSKIMNPETGRRVLINSKVGKKVLMNYLQLGGSESTFCSVCKLDFGSIDKIQRHKKYSALHKKRLEKQSKNEILKQQNEKNKPTSNIIAPKTKSANIQCKGIDLCKWIEELDYRLTRIEEWSTNQMLGGERLL